MGLYDSWNLNLELGNYKTPLLILVAIVAVVLIAWAALNLSTPDPLQVSVNGPIDLTTNAQGFPIQPNAELTITVSNPQPEAVHNVSVFVESADAKALIVFPDTIALDTLDKKRSVQVSVRPNPVQRVLSGTYLVNVKALIEGQEYAKTIELEVKNPENQ